MNETDRIGMEMVLSQVLSERERQYKKWGPQNHAPIRWLPILAEEFGEVSKEVCKMYEGNVDLVNYREELIQTAAVCVAMVESLDRGNE